MHQPDPREAWFLFASGRKKTGKSHYCRQWFDAYPYDKMVIDVTGDVREDFRRDGVRFADLGRDILPARFPASLDENEPYVTAIYCPDMGSATAGDDIDRAAGLLLRGRKNRGMLWLDEAGHSSTGNKTPPNMKRILHHGRHHNLQLLMACPRPMDIDPLCLSQADLIVTFRTVNTFDLDRLAKSTGYDPGEFAQINREHCHDHAFTAFDPDDEDGLLRLCPPLPPRRAGRNLYPAVPE